jgi:hypothetical protein
MWPHANNPFLLINPLVGEDLKSILAKVMKQLGYWRANQYSTKSSRHSFFLSNTDLKVYIV